MPMRNIRIVIGDTTVEGEPEGDARWIIRACRGSQARVRIGWLFGSRGSYIAETVGRPGRTLPGRTRRAALQQLLDWARGLPGGSSL